MWDEIKEQGKPGIQKKVKSFVMQKKKRKERERERELSLDKGKREKEKKKRTVKTLSNA